MLRAVVRFSLRYRGTVIALACGLLLYGIYTLGRARYNVFPEFTPPQVSIQTEAPGLAPDQVETLVTRPIESLVLGAPGVQTVRSGSIQGLSVITIRFNPGSAIYLDRQVLSERLASLSGQLPAGMTPVMTPLTSSTSVVMSVGLTWPGHSLMALSTVADWTVKQRLLAVPGVAKVAIFGDQPQQLQFQFDPQRLMRYGLTVQDVLAAAGRVTGIRGAGFVDTPNQRVVLTSASQTVTPALAAGTVLLRQQGVNVTLGDVAHVTFAPTPAIGAATVDGTRGLALVISSQYGANTLDVTSGLDQALSELAPTLREQGIQVSPGLFRTADFIHAALGNVRSALIIGGILVVVVLTLILFDLRMAAISCTAIPLSLLGAVIVLNATGQGLNTMTLGGLAIAIGEVVDDAIIDVENIHRRFRENSRAAEPRPLWRVALDASIEVRSAVIYATFAVVLVFLPVITMSGLTGRLFAPLGMAYIWAILTSLVIALTVTPALSLLLLRSRRELERTGEPPVLRWLVPRYRRLLAAVERRPRGIMAATAVLIAAAAVIAPLLEPSFLPQLREGNLTVHMTETAGTSIEESLRLGGHVTQALLKLPGVRSVAQTVGRAELSDDTNGTHTSELDVAFKPLSGAGIATAQDDIREALGGFAGATFSANTFLTERINETLSGYAAGVVVNVFGNDLVELDARAQAIVRVMQQIKGATSVQLQSLPGMPEVAITLRPQAITRWGLEPVDVLDAVRTAYSGDLVGQMYQGERVFGVSVILPQSDREDPRKIAALALRASDGVYVSLGQVATVTPTSGRYIVQHDGGRRVEAVTCDVTGRSVSSFTSGLQQRIDQLPPAPGTYVSIGGTAAEQTRAQLDLLLKSFFAGAGIVILLSIVTGSTRNLLLVLLNLPFALAGGVFAAALTGGTLSLGSLVGFVTLFGITLRNSIMLISHYEHLVAVEGMTWGPEASIRGAAERLAPIMMTALVTGLGLLPLALGAGAPGREIEGPMAIVILGGLFTSTALNLLVLPSLARRYGRFQPAAAGDRLA